MDLSKSLGIAKQMSMFGRTKALENQIDEFLDNLSESGILFRRAVQIDDNAKITVDIERDLTGPDGGRR